LLTKKLCKTALLTLFVVQSFSIARAAGPFVLGGPSASLAPSSGSWSWDGSNLAPYRSALTNTANFGPSGVVKTAITATTLTTISPSTLSGLNGFIAPWWYNTESSAYNQMVVNFFLAGGDLILLDDGTAQDGIAALLGIPDAGSSDGSLSNGPAPLFNGPFGIATNVAQSQEIGYLPMASITAHGGFACSTNASGQVTAACFPAGAYAPGSGAMIITGDVDMYTTSPNGAASYSPLNSNGIFALNGAAWLLAGAPGPVGTPTTPSAPALSPFALVVLAIVVCGVGVMLVGKSGQATV
jgi:hypothetical protein